MRSWDPDGYTRKLAIKWQKHQVQSGYDTNLKHSTAVSPQAQGAVQS